ncbi:hypothetical protein PHYPSEUDO_013151 [Phytophthora pseudosyringae]|uniref:Uncharacterized protein n=1 Tax=Phytophthora pseudosyringae TaxID=221518 RepID=A0A8T1V8D9_9STRA|nr:hypothetical protein PHYPSEUDO_013151 [Phytophthora pseudosyringae]
MLRLTTRTLTLRPSPRRSPQLSRRTQHFSSSPSPGPPSPTFYDELSQYVKRVVDRKDQLTRYQEHSVFPPSNWTVLNYFLYAQLQLPSKTELDAVEFLNGARFACDRVVRAMHAQELLDFAAGNGPRPEIADEVERMFDPMCFQRQFLPRARRLAVGVTRLELKELDFSGVYLSGVACERTTRANLKTEEKLRAAVKQAIVKKRKTNERPIGMAVPDLSAIKETMASIQTEQGDDSEILERLQLSALFRTTQTVEAVSAKTAERVAVKTDVKTTLRFESLVTEPDDVDWRIVSMNQFGRVVSRTKED